MVKVELPENFDRGAFGIERIGTYHLQVLGVDEWPQKRKTGEAIPGWRVTCGVLAGTESCETGKTIELLLRNPSASHSDGGDFCKRIQGRFLLATALVKEEDAGKEIDLDLKEVAPMRQFFAKFSVQKKQNKTDADRIDLDGDNLWHVDDGYVVDVPRDEANLKTIPPELRMISGKSSSATKTIAKASPAKATEHSEPVKSGSGKPDYDSL